VAYCSTQGLPGCRLLKGLTLLPNLQAPPHKASLTPVVAKLYCMGASATGSFYAWYHGSCVDGKWAVSAWCYVTDLPWAKAATALTGSHCCSASTARKLRASSMLTCMVTNRLFWAASWPVAPCTRDHAAFFVKAADLGASIFVTIVVGVHVTQLGVAPRDANLCVPLPAIGLCKLPCKPCGDGCRATYTVFFLCRISSGQQEHSTQAHKRLQMHQASKAAIQVQAVNGA